MASFFSNLFGSAEPKLVAKPTGRAARRPEEILQAYESAIEPTRQNDLVWLARDASYWTDRRANALARLRDDWSSNSERTKWPDVAGLLTQLSAPPEEVIRQLPAAARDAMALCDRDDLPRAQLVDRLSQDPSLVQGLLRQANSERFASMTTPARIASSKAGSNTTTRTRPVIGIA